MAYQNRSDQRYEPDKGHNSIDMKSAVISGAFEGYSKDEIDRFYTQNLSEVQLANKPKKGSFQITSVTSGSAINRDDDPGEDSQDDLDDTHTYTEDNMSMDWSKTTDLDPDKSPILEQEEPPHEEIVHRPQPKMPDLAPHAKERSSTDNQSRFRVVKIVTHEPFKRGRWTCYDYMPDPNKPNPDYVNLDLHEKDQFVVTGSETSSAASSIHYVHGQDDPSKNPLAPSVTQTLTSPVYFDSDQSKLQSVLNGHEGHGHDLLESSSVSVQPGVITPDSFPQGVPLNGTTLPYGSGQPPVHQASLPPSSQPLQSIPVSGALTQPLPATLTQPLPVITPSAIGTAPGDSSIPSSLSHNVLSTSYQPRPQLPNNGQYTTPSEVPSGTPRPDVSINRAISIDKTASRTHRISIGGEELELSDEFGKAGGLLEQIGAIGVPSSLASPTKETDGEDSGPSSVAIDNKIEQAMDLVKSHLMFAVREEVEVLKEQIQELEETKRKLEFENNFLKSVASSETLAKLAQAQQNQPPSNT